MKLSQTQSKLSFKRLSKTMAILLSDGNAFAIIGAGRRELERTERGDEVSAFTAEMTAGDYSQLLFTFFRWFPDAEVSE